MTDFKEDPWSYTWAGTDNEDILNEWNSASVPNLQEMSFWDETTNTSLEEETWNETWDETADMTPTASLLPASKARVLEALEIYPISSRVTALLERRDVNALALSCWSTFHDLSIEDPFSQFSIISQGLPEYISAPCPMRHYEMVQEGKEMDIRACVRNYCLNDVCKVSVTLSLLFAKGFTKQNTFL